MQLRRNLEVIYSRKRRSQFEELRKNAKTNLRSCFYQNYVLCKQAWNILIFLLERSFKSKGFFKTFAIFDQYTFIKFDVLRSWSYYKLDHRMAFFTVLISNRKPEDWKYVDPYLFIPWVLASERALLLGGKFVACFFWPQEGINLYWGFGV